MKTIICTLLFALATASAIAQSPGTYTIYYAPDTRCRSVPIASTTAATTSIVARWTTFSDQTLANAILGNSALRSSSSTLTFATPLLSNTNSVAYIFSVNAGTAGMTVHSGTMSDTIANNTIVLDSSTTCSGTYRWSPTAVQVGAWEAIQTPPPAPHPILALSGSYTGPGNVIDGTDGSLAPGSYECTGKITADATTLTINGEGATYSEPNAYWYSGVDLAFSYSYTDTTNPSYSYTLACTMPALNGGAGASYQPGTYSLNDLGSSPSATTGATGTWQAPHLGDSVTIAATALNGGAGYAWGPVSGTIVESMSGARPMTTGPISILYSPKGGCQLEIQNAIANAKTSIYVMSYTCTNVGIFESLVAAKNRGVDVAIVADPYCDTLAGAMVPKVAAQGVACWEDHTEKIQHEKVIVIDSHLVFCGSYNWSTPAETMNAEDLVQIDDIAIAQSFTDNFRYHQSHSTRIGPAATGIATTCPGGRCPLSPPAAIPKPEDDDEAGATTVPTQAAQRSRLSDSPRLAPLRRLIRRWTR